MKERDFLKALNNLKEPSNASIDVSLGVAIEIGRKRLLKVFLTAVVLFPFSMYALTQLVRIEAVKNFFAALVGLFNIELLSFGSHPFVSAILIMISVSFTFSFIMSFIIEGGITNEMLLSSR